MPPLTPIQSLTKRLCISIAEIKKHHPVLKNDSRLIKFMQKNGVVIHYTAISKWKSGDGFPTTEQVLFICTHFKEQAPADWVIYGITSKSK